MIATTQRQSYLSQFIRGLGYGDSLIKTDFSVWVNAYVDQFDIAAFGCQSPTDMSTSTIVGRLVDEPTQIGGALAAAGAPASPAAVFALPDSMELWSVSSTITGTRIGTTTYGDLPVFTRRWRDTLAPEALLPAKSFGFQLSLFALDVSLLTSARQKSSARLSARVIEAMQRALSASPHESRNASQRLVDAATLVVGSMAALMVRDKFRMSVDSNEQLIHDARTRFPQYFDALAASQTIDVDLVDYIFNVLGYGINYEGLDSRIVSEVYSSAVVEESERLRLGIFYTPPELARRITANIPFEEAYPEERTILDPACGSGTLLLAAYDRLQQTHPSGPDPVGLHHLLSTSLRGYDVDEFAVQIARFVVANSHSANWK